jgi:isopentenyldiphosphate isomerase
MSNVLWVDENDKILGEVAREKAHTEGLLHRIAAIYLINDKGKILVNERAKDGYFDHSSAGHVEVGESYLEAAKRELKEELGVSGVELQDIGSTNAEDTGEAVESRHIFRVYVCKVNPVKIEKREVKSVFWKSPRDVYEDMKVYPEKYKGGFKKTLELFLSKKL